MSRNTIISTLLGATLLWFASPAPSQTPAEMEQMERFLSMMARYGEVAERSVDMASREETVVLQAIEGITEIYEGRGEESKAIKRLAELLENARNQTVRNLLRLKLKDLYNETGNSQMALEQLEALLAENLNRNR